MLAGDVLRGRQYEVESCLGDFFRLGITSHGHTPAREFRLRFLRNTGRHAGTYRSRADAIDCDAAGRQLYRQRTREADDTSLAGRIGADALGGAETFVRGGIDDAAPVTSATLPAMLRLNVLKRVMRVVPLCCSSIFNHHAPWCRHTSIWLLAGMA